ncbi:hypothetical protein OESDEN_10227 [Oesophagostomum dentatum]|uniref:BLOC-1-related complex subunit 5 n=1 Tax=Oesophagostomum dentatum TaxID=61180 RepID=A0A0B1T1A2_OESDE|nr:hypothetical protein OESDEN_10227 [Oesophagostomum dentatum]
MGNEQSASTSPQAGSTFSFLSGRGPSLKKSKGIVVVSGGNSKVESLEDDEIYKRFQEIPRFLPIYRHAIGKKDLSPHEYQQKVEGSAAVITTAMVERKKASDIFVAELQTLEKLRDDVFNIQLMLEELVPMAETLNELLVPEDRLPPLALGRILERTPVSTSASSSQSTPKNVTPSNSSMLRPSPREERSHIPPIEEIRVVDRTP